jgi:hypothetical protein
MGALAKYVQTISDRKRYQIDYDDWLDAGEQVVSVAFTVENNTSTPFVIDTDMVLPTGRSYQYYASGGVDGVTYEVRAVLTTNQGPQVRADKLLFVVREP